MNEKPPFEKVKGGFAEMNDPCLAELLHHYFYCPDHPTALHFQEVTAGTQMISRQGNLLVTVGEHQVLFG